MKSAMNPPGNTGRLDYLDAVRAFALLLGIVFHASLSFLPVYIGWAVMDVSTGVAVPFFMTISHSFRMGLFFVVAGYFSHMTYHRRGAGAFGKSRLLRLGIPFVIGWFLLRPLLVSGWIMGATSLQGDVDVMAGLRGGIASLQSLPMGIFTGTHLWFLYYLMLATAVTLVLRWMLCRSEIISSRLRELGDALVERIARMRLPALAFVFPTAIALWFMNGWGMDTPDQSLRPDIPVTLVYTCFFGLGWMLHRKADWLPKLTELNLSRCALVAFAIVGTLILARKQMDMSDPHYSQFRVGYAVCYAALMWSLAFLVIGVFAKLITKKSPGLRYLADSSYWLYLIHLPIVVWLQVALAELPWHWSLKLIAISTITVGIALVMYDLFVRSTVIGKILNGRRRERVLFRMPRSFRVQTAQ